MLDTNPQIVHFSGHGTGSEGLVFEDETGMALLVDGEALAGLFELFTDQVECVVLNGCYSEVQATAIARYINYVIGMNKAIGDQAAIEFAVGFYDALGAGRPVEFAHRFGCAAIRLVGIPENLTPILKKKPGIGKVQWQQSRASTLGNRESEDEPRLNERLEKTEVDLLHQIWDSLDSDLQDALSLAYNQACRDGKHIVGTRYFFAAIARLKPYPLPELLSNIPQTALPESVNEDVTTERLLLRDNPELSSCIKDSLRHLSQKTSPQNKLSTADVFVDIVKHGTGRSVARLRTYGVTPNKVDEIIKQLGWSVIER